MESITQSYQTHFNNYESQTICSTVSIKIRIDVVVLLFITLSFPFFLSKFYKYIYLGIKCETCSSTMICCIKITKQKALLTVHFFFFQLFTFYFIFIFISCYFYTILVDPKLFHVSYLCKKYCFAFFCLTPGGLVSALLQLIGIQIKKQ